MAAFRAGLCHYLEGLRVAGCLVSVGLPQVWVGLPAVCSKEEEESNRMEEGDEKKEKEEEEEEEEKEKIMPKDYEEGTKIYVEGGDKLKEEGSENEG